MKKVIIICAFIFCSISIGFSGGFEPISQDYDYITTLASDSWGEAVIVHIKSQNQGYVLTTKNDYMTSDQ